MCHRSPRRPCLAMSPSFCMHLDMRLVSSFCVVAGHAGLGAQSMGQAVVDALATLTFLMQPPTPGGCWEEHLSHREQAGGLDNVHPPMTDVKQKYSWPPIHGREAPPPSALLTLAMGHPASVLALALLNSPSMGCSSPCRI